MQGLLRLIISLELEHAYQSPRTGMKLRGGVFKNHDTSSLNMVNEVYYSPKLLQILLPDSIGRTNHSHGRLTSVLSFLIATRLFKMERVPNILESTQLNLLASASSKRLVLFLGISLAQKIYDGLSKFSIVD